MKKIKMPAEIVLPLIVIAIGTIIPIIFFRASYADVLFSIFTYAIAIFGISLFIRYLIIRTRENNEINKVEKKLLYNLNDMDIYLIDYENTGCLPKKIKETDEKTIYYVFAGRNQNNKIKKELFMMSTKSKIEVIYVDKTGKNLLDIGLGMYVGAIYSLYSPKNVYIYSKDRGYNSLIQIAEDFGYHNIFNVSPEKDIMIKDNSILKIYQNILKNFGPREMSLGTFKKRIRKARLDITADETNYAVKRLEELGYIEVIDCDGYKEIKICKEK